MTWDEKITKLPGTAALKSMHHTADLVDELELRPGLVVPAVDDPENGIEAGKVHFTLRLTKTPNEVVQLEGYAAPLEQISTNEDGQPISPLEPGKYWIYRTGNYAVFHPNDWGKQVIQAQYWGSGHNVSRQMYGQTNDSIKGLHAQLKAVGDAMHIAGLTATVTLTFIAETYTALTTNYPAGASLEAFQAWVKDEKLMYVCDGTTWIVQASGTAPVKVAATMTQPAGTTGVDRDSIIIIQFSEAVDPLTVTNAGNGTGTFEIFDVTNLAYIAGTLATADNITFTFDPTSTLPPSANIEVRLSTDIQSADGTKGYNGNNFGFTTAANQAPTAPSNLNHTTDGLNVSITFTPSADPDGDTPIVYDLYVDGALTLQGQAGSPISWAAPGYDTYSVVVVARDALGATTASAPLSVVVTFVEAFTGTDGSPPDPLKWEVTTAKRLQATGDLTANSKLDIRGNRLQCRIASTVGGATENVEIRARSLQKFDFSTEKRVISWQMTPNLDFRAGGPAAQLIIMPTIPNNGAGGLTGDMPDQVKMMVGSTGVSGVTKCYMFHKVNGTWFSANFDIGGYAADALENFTIELGPGPDTIRFVVGGVERRIVTTAGLLFTEGHIILAGATTQATEMVRDFDDVSVT